MAKTQIYGKKHRMIPVDAKQLQRDAKQPQDDYKKMQTTTQRENNHQRCKMARERNKNNYIDMEYLDFHMNIHV